MENLALIESFSEFKDDKLIDRVTLMAILEDVFRSALKKKYGSDENFDIIINPDKGDLEIWRNRVVVADGEVEDENEEISLSEAQKIEDDFEVGEDVSEEVKLIIWDVDLFWPCVKILFQKFTNTTIRISISSSRN